MNAEDALLTALNDALQGEVGSGVYYGTTPPKDASKWVTPSFVQVTPDPDKGRKLYTCLAGITVNAVADNYSAARVQALTIAEAVEAALWPTVGYRLPMTGTGYQCARLQMRDSIGNDTLYATDRILQITLTFDIDIETT